MRKENTIKNMGSSMFLKILDPILSFVERTVFIAILSKEYLGINSLFSGVLTVLNLSELGISAAIVFAMYKPVAENDIEKIKSLMHLYRRAFRIIGAVFLTAGLIITPVIPYLANGTTNLVNLRIIFLLNILSTTTSYWFFAYRTAILSATQKEYKLAGIRAVMQLGTILIKMSVLLIFRRIPTAAFYAYTAVGIVLNVIKNLILCRKVNRMYPYLKDKNVRPLSKEEKAPIFKNIVGTATNKICWKLNDGIDSTVISALVNVSTTGVFANYIVIKNIITKLLNTVFGSVHASLGNFCAVESTEKKEKFFYTLQFTYFWLYGFSSICLWILFTPFIGGVWLRDSSWLLSGWDEFLLCFNFLIEGLAGAVVKYRDVHGMYYETRYRYILSTVLNVGLSIVLVGPAKMGVTGALLGTTASLLAVILFDPTMVYKAVFHKNPGSFYVLYFKDLFIICATAALVWLICRPFSALTFGNFAVKLAVCLIIPNGIWFLMFRNAKEFVYLRDTLRYFMKKLKRRAARS